MDNLILGLLLLSPMSGYEIQKFIKDNLALICAPSAGSMQIALHKLLAEDKIEAKEMVQGKRVKKIFMIKDKGQQAFMTWINKPMQANKAKNMELSKLFFAGMIDPLQRIKTLQAYIDQLMQIKATLAAIKLRFETLNPTDPKELWRFQAYTIAYGLAAVDFEINWYQALLKELEEETCAS
ncbi:MAG: PadR family transcriptional regulator [Erysipelotrichaceae bacterium]|nr:PadR family transcriptional regulator [Erysipelotrichaceae bacterium]MDY5251231.1 PadR family transcriptional regulator [Erysipelotrichaceae bacterium]